MKKNTLEILTEILPDNLIVPATAEYSKLYFFSAFNGGTSAAWKQIIELTQMLNVLNNVCETNLNRKFNKTEKNELAFQAIEEFSSTTNEINELAPHHLQTELKIL